MGLEECHKCGDPRWAVLKSVACNQVEDGMVEALDVLEVGIKEEEHFQHVKGLLGVVLTLELPWVDLG